MMEGLLLRQGAVIPRKEYSLVNRRGSTTSEVVPPHFLVVRYLSRNWQLIWGGHSLEPNMLVKRHCLETFFS